MFSEKDLRQIAEKNIVLDNVFRQIKNFEIGFPYLPVAGAAMAGNGIKIINDGEIRTLAEKYGQRKNLSVVKFVPASGVATRMFKDLFEFINSDDKNNTVKNVLDNISKFPFFSLLDEKKIDIGNDREVVGYILGKEGLNYGNLPKGLLLFHKYQYGSRTAVEEHLVESALYGLSNGKVAKIHFTVSPEHLQLFERHIAEVVPIYREKYGINYEVSFSCQKQSTDTIAVDMENRPFREEDGSLLFRPAGHGALLENLNEIDADVIFIKTVDNVVPDHLKSDTVIYKKAMAELMLQLQQRCSEYLYTLECGANEPLLDEIQEFITEDLSFKFGYGFAKKSNKEKAVLFRKILDRPIRVCGMVKNEGEPGGGPFWVKNNEGGCSLQIAESAQISPKDMDIMRKATHFNPVDIVCGVKNYHGEKFDLLKYTDPKTGFISEKSKNGLKLKAQELPGLWNGSMAEWNTIFVEVPITTFSPVKTINDLLRPQHQ